MAAGDEYEGPLAAHLVPNTRYKDEYRTGSELLAQARGLCYTWRRCHHRKTRLHCAVKIFDVTHMDFHEQALAVEVALLKEMRDSNAQGVTRFIGLFHSHNSAQFQLVTSYESGGEPLFDCIAHKWFRVADTFDSRPYDEESASTIFRSIVKSVNEMHQRNIVHGNLSPTAIILDHQDLNSAHLVDLQWAQKLEAGRSTHKQCGTPGYASPEQLTGLRSFRMTEFNQMADLWSLGVLMYQLLCGYPPFKGEGAEVIAATLRGKYKFHEREWRFVSDTAMNLIKRFLLRLDPAHRLTTEELLRHPWVSGQYFDDLRAKREGAHELADGNHHRKVGAHNEVLTPMNQLSGSVRRMRLCNAKRKFRSGIRTLIAQNALEGMLVGMQRQQLLLQIGAQYNEKKLMALYGLFEQQAKQDRRESKPLKNALDIMKGPKTVIAKGSFAAVVMKVLPDIARSEAAAEAHFADFRGTRLLDAVDDADFSDVDLSKYPKGKKEKEKAQVRALAEAHREVVGDLLDYRAYCVSISALCMKSASTRERLSFIFDLFDDDRSGQIDADEFAELMRGILVSESMPDGMLKMELKRDFESIDEDNNGTIDKTEFIVAATSYPRLQEYLAHLSRLATNANDEATRNQDLQEKRRAATKMQAAFRGRMDRKKVQQKAVDKDTLTHKIFTRHIVYSHPVFQTEYELSMPISQQRELALKKLFALADLEHFGRLGPSQFRDLLKLLEVDIDPGAAMRMFRHMDDDMGGFIEFEEFADAMLEGFSSEDIIAASEVEIGNMGTRMWSRGEVAWNANSAMVLCSTCIIFAGLEYFQFVLVPLLFSYFLNFLMAPLMLLLEARPCTIRQQQFCQLSAAPMRIEIHGTSKATLWDFVHSCRFPHGASVLCTLLLTILVLGGVAIVATLETMQLLNDAEFVAGWQLLVSDIRTLFKHTGVHIVTEEVDGYTADEITQFLSNFGNFFNQLALVLLLTVYIMSTHTVDKESNPLPGQASKIDAMMKFYINLKTAISLLTGIATAVILRLCGVKLAVMFGILAFLLNYIPNFGSMVAMVLPLPIILVDAGLSTVQKTLGALGPALVQGYVGNVLEPSVFGRSLNMTPLSILIALVMWMSIWGVLGAVMAVPLLGIQKIFLEHANHPIASACLILIREDPNVDEAEQARMQKRMLAKQGGEPDEPQHRRKGAIARSHSVYQEVSDEGLDYTASWRANPEHVLPMGGGLDV